MSAQPLITCRELIDFIADYFEGALATEELDDFNRHLERCASCRAYLRSYESTIRLSRESGVDDDALLDDAPEELIRAILAARR